MSGLVDRKYKEKRIPEISIAKGIGICLVVVGHCVPNEYVKQFIYLFHMPLFFFTSGYCFIEEHEQKLCNYIIKKIKSLYLPFIFCNLFALFFHQYFCKIGLYNNADTFASSKFAIMYICKIFLCIKMEDVVAPLWFLPILMFVSVIFCILKKVQHKYNIHYVLIQIIICILYIGAFIVPRTGIYRAYILISLGLLVFSIGYIFKTCQIFDKIKHSELFFIIGLLVLLIAAKYVSINMIQMQLSDFVSFIVCALLGIYIVFYISKKISKKAEIFIYIGNNSLSILVWHYWVFLILTILQNKIINKHFIEGVNAVVKYYPATDTGIGLAFILYMSLGIIIPLVLNMILKKIISIWYKKTKNIKG